MPRLGATIAGGYLNLITNGSYATVGGGYANAASTNSATVAGGYLNAASGFESTIAGGQANTASGTASFIGGGVTNIASGFEAVVVALSQNGTSLATASFDQTARIWPTAWIRVQQPVGAFRPATGRGLWGARGPVKRIRHGFMFSSQEGYKFFPMPSAHEIEEKNFKFWQGM